MPYEKTQVVRWAREQFGDAWGDECEVAFARQPVSCYVAIDHGRLAGFACHDSTCRNFFGPMGVRATARGRGIGTALLQCCLHAMAAAGYAYAIIGGAGDGDDLSQGRRRGRHRRIHAGHLSRPAGARSCRRLKQPNGRLRQTTISGIEMRLRDKIAIVTGAGSGFGEGIAKRFAQRGREGGRQRHPRGQRRARGARHRRGGRAREILRRRRLAGRRRVAPRRLRAGGLRRSRHRRQQRRHHASQPADARRAGARVRPRSTRST